MTKTVVAEPPQTVKSNIPLRKMREIAQDLGITARTLKRWNKRYKLPRIKIGKTLYYDPAAVMAHLETFHRMGGAR